MRRVAIVGLAFAALAAVLSGCVVFKAPPTVKQLGKKPKVAVKFTLCVSNTEMEPGTCNDLGNAEDSPNPGDWRTLLGFRVPKGTKVPQTIEPTEVRASGTGGVAFSRDASYKSELNAKAPRNENKFKYFGYSSNVLTFPEDGDNGTEADFKVKMTVPKKLVGKRFRVRPVVGSYQVTEDQPDDDPIDCGEDPFLSNGAGGYFSNMYRICIDSPSPDAFDNAKVKIKEKKAQ